MRTSLQQKFLGDWGDFGTGILPGEKLVRWTPKSGTPETVDSFVVNHPRGHSPCEFKSYEQGRIAFQATERHVVLLDEEPPEDIYSEVITRTMTVGGIVMLTFTPLKGVSQVVARFLTRGAPVEGAVNESRALVMAGWDDVPHLTAPDKAELAREYPNEAERQARTRGSLFVFSTGCAPAQQENLKMRIGYLQSDLHHLPAFVAVEKKYFQDAGLNVEVAGVFRAGPELMSAFAAHELDIGYVGLAPAITAVANGTAAVRYIAQVNREGSAIVVAKDAPYNKVADLQGKVVTIPGHATMQDFLLRKAFKNEDIPFNKIKLLVLKPPEMIPALDKGDIDAFIAWEPYPTKAVMGNTGRIVIKFRAPLTSIKLRVEALRDGALDDPPVTEQFLAEIESEVDRLSHVVNDLLDLSRIEAGLDSSKRVPIDLGSIVAEVYEIFIVRAEKAGVSLSYQVEAELPAVLGSEDQLRRMMYNLVDNAIKYTNPGGRVELTLQTDEQKRKLRFMVEDTGYGIAPAQLPHVFDRFYRVEATRPRYSRSHGSGLGLPIAKSIAESHGGKIGVSSQVGAGSTFWVELPVAEEI